LLHAAAQLMREEIGDFRLQIDRVEELAQAALGLMAAEVLSVRAPLEARLDQIGPLLRALAAAAQWCDEAANRPELAARLARTEYLGTPAEIVEAALGGLLLGMRKPRTDADFLRFHGGGANVPRPEDALWIYAQMARWGQLERSAAAQASAARVFRSDLLERYVGSSGAPSSRVVAFDGIAFDGRDVDGYLARFDIRTRFVSPGSDA